MDESSNSRSGEEPFNYFTAAAFFGGLRAIKWAVKKLKAS